MRGIAPKYFYYNKKRSIVLIYLPESGNIEWNDHNLKTVNKPEFYLGRLTQIMKQLKRKGIESSLFEEFKNIENWLKTFENEKCVSKEDIHLEQSILLPVLP